MSAFQALRFPLLVVGLLAAPRLCLAGSNDGPLNVLFILVDQHNERALGCTDNGFGGVTTSLTPNLDSLASEGIRFENAYTPTPQCSPTRYSLITGLWPHDHGLRWNEVWEPLGPVTLPQLAREAGYSTATIGKHHLYWLKQQNVTHDLGFDLVLDDTDYVAFCFQNMQVPMWLPMVVSFMPGLPFALAAGTGPTSNPNDFHTAGYIANRTIEFLEQRAADGAPFLCFYSMYGPHTPLLPTGPAAPQDWAHMYHPFDGLGLPPNKDKVATTNRLAQEQTRFAAVTDDEWREILSYYYGLITQIDYNVGRVLTRLEELGLADNTLVVYTADHGEMAAEMSCWAKGSGSYDAITKVPLMLRLPGVIPPGQVSGELVNTLDLVPTLLEFTGLTMEDADRARLGGSSLAELAVGRPSPTLRREVFGEFGTDIFPNIQKYRMVRTERYKYSLDTWGGLQEEFYDLVNDPWEMNDLIPSTDPAVQAEIARHRDRLERWWNDEQGHAPEYAYAGLQNALPSAASEPSPSLGAFGVARNGRFSWLPSTSAESQVVSIGVGTATMRTLAVLPPMVDSIHPGPLPPNTPIRWRVDGVNQNGTRVGPLWSFRTSTDTASYADVARPQSPSTGDGDVSLQPVLRWAPGRGATAQSVLFGRKGALERVGALDGRTGLFAPGRLEGGVEYEWRIDGITAAGVTEGDVWSFETTALGLPRKTQELAPEHLAAAVAAQPSTTLSWLPVPGQITYDVYLGRRLPLELQGNQSSTTFDAGGLDPDTTYYWRIDTVNARGTTRGNTWRFTTAP